MMHHLLRILQLTCQEPLVENWVGEDPWAGSLCVFTATGPEMGLAGLATFIATGFSIGMLEWTGSITLTATVLVIFGGFIFGIAPGVITTKLFMAVVAIVAVVIFTVIWVVWTRL